MMWWQETQWDSEAKRWLALQVAFRSLQEIMLVKSSGMCSDESYFRKWVYLPKPEEIPFDFQSKKSHFHGMSRLAWRITFMLLTTSKMDADGNDTWELWHYDARHSLPSLHYSHLLPKILSNNSTAIIFKYQVVLSLVNNYVFFQ